jgi:predicted amidohydrolase YtcJ
VPGDLIFLGGRVRTASARQARSRKPSASRRTRVVAVGRADDLKALAGPKPRVVDLHGWSLSPGFIDAHGHLASPGMSFVSIDGKAPACGRSRH